MHDPPANRPDFGKSSQSLPVYGAQSGQTVDQTALDAPGAQPDNPPGHHHRWATNPNPTAANTRFPPAAAGQYTPHRLQSCRGFGTVNSPALPGTGAAAASTAARQTTNRLQSGKPRHPWCRSRKARAKKTAAAAPRRHAAATSGQSQIQTSVSGSNKWSASMLGYSTVWSSFWKETVPGTRAITRRPCKSAYK